MTHRLRGPVRWLPTIPEDTTPPRYAAGDRVLFSLGNKLVVAELLGRRARTGDVVLCARLSTGQVVPIADDDARVLRRITRAGE